jgi:hypothetical protein
VQDDKIRPDKGFAKVGRGREGLKKFFATAVDSDGGGDIIRLP